ncbi:MAG: Cof-type HAD-IIB family hydrolase [Novosphingobium sp.]
MKPGPIRLLVSDIDGTLVRHDKGLPEENVTVIRAAVARGLKVSLISARPAAGILPIAAELGLEGPFGAINGGTIFDAAGAEMCSAQVPADLARQLIDLYAKAGVTIWLFATNRWLTTDLGNSHSPREVLSSGLQPEAVTDFADYLDDADKVVAVCDNPVEMTALEAQARAIVGSAATLVRSQDYYLDCTALAANKGDGVTRLAEMFGVPLAEVAVIGDQGNDVAMFRVAGLAIAMGQSNAAVQAEADCIAASNEDAGVADAIRRFILPRLPQD